MTKQIWYGAKDNDVRFAETQDALTSQGINNPQSFSVEGEVTGLHLTGTNTQQGSSSAQAQS